MRGRGGGRYPGQKRSRAGAEETRWGKGGEAGRARGGRAGDVVADVVGQRRKGGAKKRGPERRAGQKKPLRTAFSRGKPYAGAGASGKGVPEERRAGRRLEAGRGRCAGENGKNTREKGAGVQRRRAGVVPGREAGGKARRCAGPDAGTVFGEKGKIRSKISSWRATAKGRERMGAGQKKAPAHGFFTGEAARRGRGFGRGAPGRRFCRSTVPGVARNQSFRPNMVLHRALPPGVENTRSRAARTAAGLSPSSCRFTRKSASTRMR